MRNTGKFFIVVELLLLIIAAWQIFSEVELLVVILLAAACLNYVSNRRNKSTFQQVLTAVSVVAILIALLSSPAIWLMLVIAVVYLGLRGMDFSQSGSLNKAPWQKKQMIMVKTVTGEPKNGRRFKRPWFGTQRFGQQVFEWEDINLTVFSGDTIVDLGNTILPKQDNVVVIRKGFGKTRIIVPVGIGILIDHSALKGKLSFDEAEYHLNNESYRLYSDDYDDNARRLKIVTNTLVGDLEVIRL